jgi:molybdopterin molybdotransferase
MLQIPEARQKILAGVPPHQAENVALSAAHGRFLAEDIAAPADLPGFDNSAMDGYAVRAADVAGATADKPAELRLIGRVAAGGGFAGEIGPGACVRVFTGSPLPAGADAVVMQEDCAVDPAASDRVKVMDAVKPWENVRFRGEDVKQGRIVAAKGARLTAGRVALLAALGVGSVRVGRQPVVGLIATGNELREAGEPLAPGQIYESNRAGLALLAARAGGTPKIYPLVPDEPAATRAVLERALAECDVVVSSGGVSVGEHDCVKDAFVAAGGEVNFWRVAIKPGKPLVFGRHGTKIFFGLPGNPVSAVVGFEVFVRPVLLRWQGAAEVEPETVPGVLAEPLENRGDRPHYIRVRFSPDGRVTNTGPQASHILSSLADANGLVMLPPNTVWPAGRTVSVIRLD